ncbi:hypothetical protein THAR02_03863 [Trichoderma harzianum]|uniref:Uncharacterized protein n=1 Tax=Trichoderma harzianum TaxID=5544 RepID=A0A0F9ZUY1_TRIHA|nr:hypothetical protein THAR02_03863 [Trichoderma harzianum]
MPLGQHGLADKPASALLGGPHEEMVNSGRTLTPISAIVCSKFTFWIFCFLILPPHVVSITKSPRDWTTLLIDTELGVGLWYEYPGEVRDWPLREKVLGDPYDYEEDEEQAEWRGECGAWSIPDFFEVLKDQFRKLKFVPKSPCAVVDVYISEGVAFPDMIEMLQGIYREHGWPDMEKYRKKDCLKAVQKALKERYPRLADSDWVEEE